MRYALIENNRIYQIIQASEQPEGTISIPEGYTGHDLYWDGNDFQEKKEFEVTFSNNKLTGIPLNTLVGVQDSYGVQEYLCNDGFIEFSYLVPETISVLLSNDEFLNQILELYIEN